MRNIIRFSAMVALVCTALLSASLVSANSHQAAESLRKHLDAMTSLQGKFEQTVSDAEGVVQDTASGNFMLMRPGKFYWETTAPMKQLLISNGKSIWLYDPDLETVNVREFTDDLRQTPALLLSEDVAKLQESFSILAAQQSNNTVQYTLVPKVTDGLFQQLVLVFTSGNLVEFSIEDSLGQRTRCVLSDLKRNQALPEEKFYFQIPTGVEVIKN